jgi:predicted aspartyl protease
MRNLLGVLIILALATSAGATEYFKYTDPNGVVFWLDDKRKIPPPFQHQYKYEDKNGLTFWVKDVSKIPLEYRKKSAKTEEKAEKAEKAAQSPLEKRQYATRISIHSNQIIVPVIFRNKGRRVKARMILDTGASVTTLYAALASDLHLKKNILTRVTSLSANGSKTDSMLTKVDYIEVDDKILAHAEVVVMPLYSNIGADGLLGNSFLRFFNFTIDYENQLLRWN